MPPKPDLDPNGLRGLAEGGMIVGQLVAPIVIGVWADNRWQCSPWGASLGILVGFVGGGWAAYRAYKRMNENDQRGGTPPTGT